MNRKLLLILPVIGCLCAGLGVLTANVVRRGQVAPAVSVTAPPPQEHIISLSFAGDCTLGSDPRFAYEGSFHARFEKEDAAYFFRNVAPIFKADTLTFVNFEGTLTESEERADKAYTFKGPAHYAKILTEGGVEAVSLANNHTYDFGEKGMEDTRRALEEEGIAYAYKQKTALFSVSPGEEAVLVKKGTEKGAGQIYIGICAFSVWYDGSDVRVEIEKAISDLRAEGADLVFVSAHWGLEGENFPYAVQKNIGRFAIDKGADGVLGHHPHVLQGIEKYKGKEIVYSMGNFCFGGNHNPADKDTMIYQLRYQTIDGVLTGKWESRIVPCRISGTDSFNDYKPTPAQGAEKERILKRIEAYAVDE